MTTEHTTRRTPAVIGFLVAGAVLLGASFLASTRSDAPPDALPDLEILTPTSGDTVANPISIVFRTPAPLALDPAMGWSAGELHPHAMVNGREIMPAAADIAPADTTFVWRLPRLEPGTHRVHLTWAGRHHGNLSGASNTLTVHVRD